MKKIFLRYFSTQNGTTIIEYAIVFPVMAVFFLGVFETALVTWGNGILSSTLTQVAFQSARGCVEGDYDKNSDGNCRVAASMMTASKLNEVIDANGFGLISSANVCLTAGVVGDDAPATPTPAPDINLGYGGDVVVYYISYDWPVFMPIMQKIMGTSVNFHAMTIVRNDDFGAISNVTRKTARGSACS
jgi:Flp pilus assembly protein TadG